MPTSPILRPRELPIDVLVAPLCLRRGAMESDLRVFVILAHGLALQIVSVPQMALPILQVWSGRRL